MIKKDLKPMDKLCPYCHSVINIAEETVERSVMPKDGNIFDKRIWRVGDVAKVVGCSEGHIYNLASQDEIPKVKKGKFLFFIPEEILEWILKGD